MQSQSREATVAQSQSRSDCYQMLLNMQSHSREATVMPRRRGVAASINLNRSLPYLHTNLASALNDEIATGCEDKGKESHVFYLKGAVVMDWIWIVDSKSGHCHITGM